MQQVLSLATEGCDGAQPNPRVACIIVKDGMIVGQGVHLRAGENHAERQALLQAGNQARGATAYVNLEPCCHQGKTPPCTDALIDAGISKVVAAMKDPNPLVAGGGFETLRLAGISVVEGVSEARAIELNRGFVSRMRRRRPWLMLKSAATIDGRTASSTGESKWITGEAARHNVQQLRAASAAVVTGIETVLADDPELTVRLPDCLRQPWRVLLDSQLRLPLEAKIIGDDGNLLVFCCSEKPQQQARLADLGVTVIVAPQSSHKRVDLQFVMQELNRLQCNELMLEAGATLAGAFLSANLVDELMVYLNGSILGNQARAMFVFPEPLKFYQRPIFALHECHQLGDDIRLAYMNSESLRQLDGG